MEDKHCVWTDKPIRQDFDVDHVIPFALWKSNDLWNLLPVLPEVNNEKRDRLPTQQVLRASKDRILHCWGRVRSCHATRFDREAETLCGDWDPANWENQLFGGLAEAVEITAVQRGVGRWQPEKISVLVQWPARPAASPVPYPEARSSSAYVTDLKEEKFPAAPPVTAGRSTPTGPLFVYADIEAEAFQRYLPVVASLAAGAPFDGFEVDGLDWAPQCSWVEVPRHLAGKNRFVIRVAGDSMEPALRVWDLVVFEYHRTPRKDNQVVIANLTAFGIDSSARTAGAVKRLTQDAQSWIFRSDNPAYEDISVPKADCQYPILGIMVGTLFPTEAKV
jgi:phage repressor protein C with HTH and peptisase S24 domain